MNLSYNPIIGAMLAVVSACSVHGQSLRSRMDTPLEPLGSTKLDRFGLSYRMGFNISAKFKGLGGYTVVSPPGNPQRTPNGDPWNYDNGYVYSDTTQNAHPGYTWYYGYSAGTPQRPGGAPTDFDLYRSSSPAGVASRDRDGDPQHGVELTYNRQVGRVGNTFWGIEAGLSFMDVTIHDNRTYNAAAVRTTDTFRTGDGAVLKPAPFSGNAQGPPAGDPNGWPLVGITPVSTASSTFVRAATIAGNRQFDAQIFSLRFGPYLDFPITERFTFSCSAGLALLEIASDFKFSEAVSIDPSVSLTTLPPQSTRGSGSKDDLLVGGYATGTFSYALNERWRLFAGAQFQYAGDYNHKVAGKKAALDLGQSVFVPVGLSFSF